MYNNNPQLSPPKKDVIPKVSEYQKQFKPFKLVPVPQEEQEIPKKKTKVGNSCDTQSDCLSTSLLRYLDRNDMVNNVDPDQTA